MNVGTGYMLISKVKEKTFYWKGWSGASESGKPKWIKQFSTHCVFRNVSTIFKLLGGSGSNYFSTKPSMQILEVEVVAINKVVPVDLKNKKYLTAPLDKED